ncbi:MAG: cation:proton antiporter [Caldilineaceae bacterium]|nr:cation:proton antiporter [Caldilineaceae bacterium]
MTLLLAFAFLLLLAVLLSGVADQSVLSIAVLFLGAGILFGDGVLGLIHVEAENLQTRNIIEIALFSVLFTDSMHFNLGQIRGSWRLPVRALALGMPMTLLAIALLARLLTQLNWVEAFLIGAILSPTDPIFAAAIVTREEMPPRLRQLLNVESGLNDGLALPAIVLMLEMLGKSEHHLVPVLGELVWGVILGIGVAYGAVFLIRRLSLPPVGLYKPLYAFAIGLLVLSLAQLFNANLFLAAYAAGMTIATTSAEVRDAFQPFGETISELLKLVALLVFGALLTFSIFTSLSLWADLFAILIIFLIRPLVIEVALIGSTLSWQERAVAAWFGPKGFASIFYGLLILEQDAAAAEYIAQLSAVVITLSIVAHSSTDVLATRWFQKQMAK